MQIKDLKNIFLSYIPKKANKDINWEMLLEDLLSINKGIKVLDKEDQSFGNFKLQHKDYDKDDKNVKDLIDFNLLKKKTGIKDLKSHYKELFI